MSNQKAFRVKCPECGQMVLTSFSCLQQVIIIKGHCKPTTVPRESVGCDCPGSYRPVLAVLQTYTPEATGGAA